MFQALSTHHANQNLSSVLPWYALQTRCGREKLSAGALLERGFEPYLPTYKVRRRWSDRVVEIEKPVFPGYLFCRFQYSNRRPIITTPGVISIVAFDKIPAAIENRDIEAIRIIQQAGCQIRPFPFLCEGQRVQVIRGPLKGLEGILVRLKSELRVVVSVFILQRSISVEIDSQDLA